MAVKKAQAKQEVQVVGFYIGADEYAINIAHVREIGGMMEIRKVPRTPKFVEGVINLRGRIIPVIDLRKRFDIQSSVETPQAKILIVEFGKSLLGMIVDNVSEVFRLSGDQLEDTPDLFSASIDSQYISAVGKLENRIIILLDVKKLLSFDEQNQLAGLKA